MKKLLLIIYKKNFVIIEKSRIITYWSPEVLRIPVCPDVLSGIVIISLTFLVLLLIFEDSLGFPRNCHPWICYYLLRWSLQESLESRIGFLWVPYRPVGYYHQVLPVAPRAPGLESALCIQDRISFHLSCLFFC